MGTIWQDIRYSGRMLWKHRLPTLVSVLAFAVGIGVNTAMFSVAEAFLLHPAPFENANRIVALIDSRPHQNIDLTPLRRPPTSTGGRKCARSIAWVLTRGTR